MDFIGENAGLNARISIHNSLCLFNVRVEYTHATYLGPIAYRTYDGEFSLGAKLQVPPAMLPYDFFDVGLVACGACTQYQN